MTRPQPEWLSAGKVIQSSTCFRMGVLAFDVYGTLVDVHAIEIGAEPLLGSQTSSFVALWREKTVEYAFRRGLMQRYLDFGECRRQALDFVDVKMRTKLTPQSKQALADGVDQWTSMISAGDKALSAKSGRGTSFSFSGL